MVILKHTEDVFLNHVFYIQLHTKLPSFIQKSEEPALHKQNSSPTKDNRMGNCLVLQESVVKIMKTDGKILEYKAPIKVQQVLTEFSGHAVADSLRHLQPNTRLHGGQLYYLIPPPPPSAKARKKKVRFADQEVEGVQENKVVRIKLVISKQELHNMLHEGGISVTKMMSLVHGEEGIEEEDKSTKSDGDFREWKPALESIPEVN